MSIAFAQKMGHIKESIDCGKEAKGKCNTQKNEKENTTAIVDGDLGIVL